MTAFANNKNNAVTAFENCCFLMGVRSGERLY